MEQEQGNVCECAFRTARIIVEGYFYDRMYCEKCGQIINPGAKRFVIRGVKDKDKDKDKEFLQDKANRLVIQDNIP